MTKIKIIHQWNTCTQHKICQLNNSKVIIAWTEKSRTINFKKYHVFEINKIHTYKTSYLHSPFRQLYHNTWRSFRLCKILKITHLMNGNDNQNIPSIIIDWSIKILYFWYWIFICPVQMTLGRFYIDNLSYFITCNISDLFFIKESHSMINVSY